ncbi:unnamed protein product [Mytilus edulis]|uniref:Integrase catalytic domain-containing protein n=1 Tax=Mytilus edulis TaxID=6550 RepID=A0A8S3RKX8_MYTED|nr:unnamed protein product [Mytilus edulis]
MKDTLYQISAKKVFQRIQIQNRFGRICRTLYRLQKAKEEHQNWGAKKIVDELKVPFSDRMVKKFLSLYFYDQESKCIYKKSQDLNSNHGKCLDKEQLIHLINKTHMKDHRKYEAIYDCLRSTVFPVVRESIKVLFKLNVNCQCCNNAVEIPKTTVLRRPIPATYANSRWQIDLKKMPPVRGYNYICNIVDCFSRLAFGGPIKRKICKRCSRTNFKICLSVWSAKNITE